MTAAVAVFVKTPGLSPIKTRLARGIGTARAEEWHRRSSACVFDAARASGLPVYWAIAEDDGMRHPLWARGRRLAQGAGGLGTRMARIHAELVRRHGAGLLVGADLPQLDPRDLESAAQHLDRPARRFVMGRASDGGFWLFGANAAVAPSIWASVDYSRRDTADRLVDAVGRGEWCWLPTRTDLDEGDDIPRIAAELRALPDPTARQHGLAEWLETLPEAAV